MAITAGDIVRVSAEMSRAGADDIFNVYNFRIDTPNPGGDGPTMGNLADLLDDIYTFINLDIPLNVQYDTITGINVTKDELLPAQSWPVLTAGVAVGEPLPNQISACVFWRTLRPKTRASKFLPYYTEAANTGNGTILAGAVTRMQAYGDALVGSIVEGLTTLTYGAFNAPLARFTPVTQAVVPAFFRTQRRRRLGVGS